MKNLFWVLVCSLSFAAFAAEDAAKHNPMLQYTMKAISRDVELIGDPLKKPAADVTDATILTAVARARTAAFQLQLIVDRKDGELKPPGLEGLSESKVAEALEQYAAMLKESKDILAAAEKTLLEQYNEPVPEKRSFNTLKNTLAALTESMKKGHIAFKPPQP